MNLKAKKGFVFKDLIDFEDTEEKINYKGYSWYNSFRFGWAKFWSYFYW